MGLADRYFLVTMVVMFATRVTIYILPISSPTIKQLRIHHWMYGLLLIVGLLATAKFYQNLDLLAVGSGLLLDEIGLIIIQGKTHQDNYSPVSFMLIMFFTIILFVLRAEIVKFYLMTAAGI